MNQEHKTLAVPADYPDPRYTFGQTVYLQFSEQEPCIVVGMRMYYSGYFDDITPSTWEYEVRDTMDSHRGAWYEEHEMDSSPWPDQNDYSTGPESDFP